LEETHRPAVAGLGRGRRLLFFAEFLESGIAAQRILLDNSYYHGWTTACIF